MITLQRSDIFLEYDAERGAIQSLKNGKREYVKESAPVFEIALRNQAGEQSRINVWDMKLQGCGEEPDGFKAVYDGGGLTVTVLVHMTESVQWKISIEQKEQKALEWVDFPKLAVPNDLKDSNGKSKILWGYNEGVIVDDLTHKEAGDYRFKEPGYPTSPIAHIYPGMVETQFMAYFDEVTGLYFGAHDKDGHLKNIDFYPYKNGIMLHFRHYCGCGYGESYEMPYAMVMEFFQGEWQNGAQIYREWFEECGREGFVPISKNNRLPDWYGESPVVVTYPVRGTYDTDEMEPNKLYPYINAMKHIERLEKELGSKLLVLLMHWEGTAPWAPPYVWPPYGGEEKLREFIDALHQRGDLLGVYCSGIGWSQYSKLVDNYNREEEFKEKHLEKVMCLSPSQELLISDVVPHIRRGYDMCPTQRFTVDVMKGEVESMVSAGIDYIQLLDQQSGGTAYFCYGKNHGHPPVPGKWQVDAVKNMLSEIEEHTGNVLLGTEAAAAESFIPYLLFSDNRFAIGYSIGRPVPVYSYIFHEYVNNFTGNQVWCQGHVNFDRSPENVLERLAYSFSAGDMLTVVLNEDGEINWCWDCDQFVDHLPEQQSIKDFVKNLNGWRRGRTKKYLHTGKMVRPYALDCGEHILHCVVRDRVVVLQKLHTSAWEAEDGSFGQFLINYQSEDVTCRMELPEGTWRICENEHIFRTVPGGIQTITVKALTAVLVENQG